MNYAYILIIVITITATDIGQTILHESTHETIYKEYGCQATISYGLHSKTIGYCANITEKDSQDLNLAHAITEAIGYQIAIPTILLSVIAVTLVVIYATGQN